MTWKAHIFLKGDKISNQNNPFGLHSNKTPPTILEMKSFKSRVVIGSGEGSDVRTKLKHDTVQTSKRDLLFVFKDFDCIRLGCSFFL